MRLLSTSTPQSLQVGCLATRRNRLSGVRIWCLHCKRRGCLVCFCPRAGRITWTVSTTLSPHKSSVSFLAARPVRAGNLLCIMRRGSWMTPSIRSLLQTLNASGSSTAPGSGLPEAREQCRLPRTLELSACPIVQKSPDECHKYASPSQAQVRVHYLDGSV